MTLKVAALVTRECVCVCVCVFLQMLACINNGHVCACEFITLYYTHMSVCSCVISLCTHACIVELYKLIICVPCVSV